MPHMVIKLFYVFIMYRTEQIIFEKGKETRLKYNYSLLYTEILIDKTFTQMSVT